MTLQGRRDQVALYGLCAILLFSGIAKAVSLSGASDWTPRLAMTGEFLMVGLLLWKKTSRLGVAACLGTFLGMAIATVALVQQYGALAQCGCLGPLRATRGEMLAVQGLVILLASSVRFKPRLILTT